MAEMDRRRFFGVTGAAVATSALALQHDEAASAVDPSDDQSDESAAQRAVVVSAVSEVRSLDPALAVDTETERVCRQVFETLIGIERETGNIAPLLAADWEISDDQLTYTFELQEGVTFQDGSELTAEVVVANIERWSRLDEIYGDEVLESTVPLAFASVFGGFIGDDACVLESAEAEDERTVVLTLREPVVFLLQALTLPAFGIVSAEALSGDSDRVSESPVGTGAFQLVSAEDGEIVLRAFEEYWNGSPEVEQVTVRSLPRSFDRLRELQRGTLDVYEYVTRDNLRTLVQSGRMFLQRDPFSVLYLGFNLDHPVMSDPLVREAIARAVDRGSLVRNHFLEGTRTAHQFIPAALGVHSEEALRYSMHLEEAERLLQESDYDGEELPFYYPMNATRSYLPLPEAIFASIARDLTRVGLNVAPRPVPWNDGYVDRLLADEDRAMHLLGRNGGYRSPHSFFGPLFSSVTAEFNYDNEDVRELIHQARSETDDESRDDLYREAAELIAEDIPALPLAYPISGLALGQNIVNYPFSPVLHELYRDIVPQ
ncbi:ABC transporter substrate-binding protein [Nesterenkonia lacusekhoensis]|uniref:Peptide/nickel transport system substrate-binding protein n=1 Tax=Nesterenkonia lacusekhoensis TaxID=150832 RepID=A0ABS4T0D1_9MICC|nr:ABC transporter substrate-binding protein [Nesterenkonia lacusekhoensis]MBP2317863.1 peptide/nickel transport system substrate-binding protein [Nesterenkonia lacusekhoensis]